MQSDLCVQLFCTKGLAIDATVFMVRQVSVERTGFASAIAYIYTIRVRIQIHIESLIQVTFV